MLVYGKYECFVMQMLYVCVLCLLILVENARGDHMEEAHFRAGLMTDLYVAMSVSFCLPHPVAVGCCFVYPLP